MSVKPVRNRLKRFSPDVFSPLPRSARSLPGREARISSVLLSRLGQVPKVIPKIQSGYQKRPLQIPLVPLRRF